MCVPEGGIEGVEVLEAELSEPAGTPDGKLPLKL